MFGQTEYNGKYQWSSRYAKLSLDNNNEINSMAISVERIGNSSERKESKIRAKQSALLHQVSTTLCTAHRFVSRSPLLTIACHTLRIR